MYRKTALLAALALVAGCQTVPEDASRATASLAPTKGNKTLGEVTFEQLPGGKVRVVATVARLKPNAECSTAFVTLSDFERTSTSRS